MNYSTSDWGTAQNTLQSSFTVLLKHSCFLNVKIKYRWGYLHTFLEQVISLVWVLYYMLTLSCGVGKGGLVGLVLCVWGWSQKYKNNSIHFILIFNTYRNQKFCNFYDWFYFPIKQTQSRSLTNNTLKHENYNLV